MENATPKPDVIRIEYSAHNVSYMLVSGAAHAWAEHAGFPRSDHSVIASSDTDQAIAESAQKAGLCLEGHKPAARLRDVAFAEDFDRYEEE